MRWACELVYQKRGDAQAVLQPEDESKFEKVTYTYYQQLNGYQYLKQLDIGYFFYVGPYSETILKVLNPAEKTIVHIPNVNARESTKDKIREVEHILEELGDWQGTDPKTGFQLVKTVDGKVLKIADLDASEAAVAEAVNDTLKAIAASLLMEQVLAPPFEFKPKNPNNGPTPGLDYGAGGYDPGECNVGVDPATGLIQLEIKGLAEPKSQEAACICREDLNELLTAFVQDKAAMERGMFDTELVPEELTQVRMGKIVKEKFPNLDSEDQEAVRQHAIAALNSVQQARKALVGDGGLDSKSTALIDGVRKFALSVKELDIDLIDRINPFGEAYAILAKSMSEARLKVVAASSIGLREGEKYRRKTKEAREAISRGSARTGGLRDSATVKKARQVGLEPTTFPLTAGCSTIELLSKLVPPRSRRLDNVSVGQFVSRL